MTHEKFGSEAARLLVIALLAVVFGVAGWDNANASPRVQAANATINATIVVSMPMSGTTPMQQVSQADMCQMITMMADMHRQMAQMYDCRIMGQTPPTASTAIGTYPHPPVGCGLLSSCAHAHAS